MFMRTPSQLYLKTSKYFIKKNHLSIRLLFRFCASGVVFSLF